LIEEPLTNSEGITNRAAGIIVNETESSTMTEANRDEPKVQRIHEVVPSSLDSSDSGDGSLFKAFLLDTL